MNERELIDDILYRIEADQNGMIDWIDPVGRARLASPLEAANARIRQLEAARDRPWTYRISIPDGNPTWPGCVNYDLRLVDTGYSDRVLLMESKEVNEKIASLREAVRVLAEELIEWRRSSRSVADVAPQTQSNPTAKAAIEAARKEHNGRDE